MKAFAATQRGGKNPKALLSDEQATEIRKLFESGTRQCDLARMFGVDTVCIHRIVRRKTYSPLAGAQGIVDHRGIAESGIAPALGAGDLGSNPGTPTNGN